MFVLYFYIEKYNQCKNKNKTNNDRLYAKNDSQTYIVLR